MIRCVSWVNDEIYNLPRNQLVVFALNWIDLQHAMNNWAVRPFLRFWGIMMLNTQFVVLVSQRNEKQPF